MMNAMCIKGIVLTENDMREVHDKYELEAMIDYLERQTIYDIPNNLLSQTARKIIELKQESMTPLSNYLDIVMSEIGLENL